MSRVLTDGEIKALFRQLVKAAGGVEACGVELGIAHQRVSLLQNQKAPDMPTLRQIMALEVVAQSPVISGAMARAIKGDAVEMVSLAAVEAVQASAGALRLVHDMDADGHRDADEIRRVQQATQDNLREARELADAAAALTPGAVA